MMDRGRYGVFSFTILLGRGSLGLILNLEVDFYWYLKN